MTSRVLVLRGSPVRLAQGSGAWPMQLVNLQGPDETSGLLIFNSPPLRAMNNQLQVEEDGAKESKAVFLLLSGLALAPRGFREGVCA